MSLDNVNSLQNRADNIQSWKEEGGEVTDIELLKLKHDVLQMKKEVDEMFSNVDLDFIENAYQMKNMTTAEIKMLFDQCHLKIPFDFRDADLSTKKDMIDMFKAFLSLKSMDVSMILNIAIDAVEDLELWKSLGVLGEQVKSAKLNIIDDKAELLSNLFNIMPNLNNLSFKELDNYNPKIIKVLNSAMSGKDQRPLFISNLILEPETWRQLEDIEKFADIENIKIKELEFHLSQFSASNENIKVRVVNVIRKLLSTSQNTLKTMSFKNGRYRPEIIKVLTQVMSTAKRNQNPLVVSQLAFKPKTLEQLEDIEDFADCKSIVIEDLSFTMKHDFLLDVPDQEVRIANITTKLLSTSKASLKKLLLLNIQHHLLYVDFPIMTELIHMQLKFHLQEEENYPPYKFPFYFRFSEKVPNLQDISIDYSGKAKGAGSFQHLFQETGASSSVKIVKGSGFNLSDTSVDLLFRTFPYMEDLQLTRINRWTEAMFFSLWNLGCNLKNLNLSINLDKLVGDPGRDWSLDSSFTGFTPETVNKMKEAINLGTYKPEELRKLRVGPSILNLKELESFSVQFLGWNTEKSQKELPKRAFLVAAKYGFNLLPKNPRIFINAERYKEGAMEALDEVSKLPNVTVQFEE